MERFDLIKEFKKLDDPRRGQGRMHTIDIVLMIVILGTMSGFYGYRALGDFVNRYYCSSRHIRKASRISSGRFSRSKKP